MANEPGAEPASTPKPALRVDAQRRALTLVSTGIASLVAGRSPTFQVDLPLTTVAIVVARGDCHDAAWSSRTGAR